MPPSASPGAIESYYDDLAPRYDDDRFGNSYGAFVDAQERTILKHWLHGIAPSRVVDLGCGTGRLLDFAGTGIDVSEGMLAVAARKHPDRRLLRASLEELDPSLHGTYAVATCFHVLMHLDEPTLVRILERASSLVEPGGHLIVDIPSRHRRRWKRRSPSATGWHGNTDATAADLRRWGAGRWALAGRRGLLTFPIHRLPSRWRPLLGGLDAWLGRTPLGRWSSYHVYRLERLP
ncbi:MAG: class I SAM-dependent methyltransferase [Fibrobacteria bacterium]|nr:class I SAM-dependent methyltransferase [Fibrobacteria bacterium]